MKCRSMTVDEGRKAGISSFPNFHRNGSIKGMKKRFYGEDALLVQCGSYIYHVNQKVYDLAGPGGACQMGER